MSGVFHDVLEFGRRQRVSVAKQFLHRFNREGRFRPVNHRMTVRAKRPQVPSRMRPDVVPFWHL